MTSFILSSFNVIIFLFLAAMTMSNVATAWAAAGVVRSMTAKVYPCAHPVALNAAHSTVIHNTTLSRLNSQTECVSTCFGNTACTAAAHVKHVDGVTSTCFLLGGISRTPVVLEEQGAASSNANNDEALAGSGEECLMLVLNPCPAGIEVSRGQCQCPEGRAGHLCELTNPEECSNKWKNVYMSNGTGDTSIVINANKDTAGGYLKVALTNTEGSALVLRGNYFFHGHGLPFASQVTRTLTRKSWNEFEDNPAVTFRFVRSDGSIHSFTGASTTLSQSQMERADWFVRQPHAPHVLYKYSSTGGAVGGDSLADAISAVKKGQDVVTFNAVQVPPSSAIMILTRYHYEISRSDPYNFPSSPYWINTKYTTGGTLYKTKNYVVSSSFITKSKGTASATLQSDPCWTPATTDRLGDDSSNAAATTTTTTTNDRPTFAQLVAAVVNGHLARVLVGDTALTVDQVAIAGDVAVFGALPFLDPVGDAEYAQAPLETHIVAATDGQVFTCQIPQTGPANYTNTTKTDTVTWFVDTRHRERVFSVTSNGEILLGSETRLYDAAIKGATVHIGILFSEPNHYLLLRAAAVEATAEGHVAAQTEGLSRLPILNGRVTPWRECGLTALLVTSQGTVRQYEYTHYETGSGSGTHSTLTGLTVDWFVDPYA